MTAEQNKQLVIEMFDALGRGDYAAYEKHLADDLTITMIGSTVFSGTHTKEEFKKKVAEPAFKLIPDGVPNTPTRFIAEGDTVVIQAYGRSMTKDGRPYNNELCLVWTFEDGKLARAVEYFDTALVQSVFGS